MDAKEFRENFAQKKQSSKFRNVPTIRQGWRFDSKAEAEFYDHLQTLKLAGSVNYFLPQVPFRLGPGVTYRCDFLVVMKDGRIRVVDVKGMETAMFKMKKKLVEFAYPVEIEVVRKTRKGFSWP